MNTNNPSITVQNTAQQGDVLLKKIEKFPEGKKTLVSQGKMVLAEGEVTGHFHGIAQDNSSLYRMDGGAMVLDLKEEAILTHQEHGPITLSPGLWDVGIVQEYDYFTQMVAPVRD